MLTCIKRAFVKTLPVMAGYMVLGFGFGIITVEAGYGFWVALLMSVLIYAGSMQYVLVSLLTGGASLISGVVTTLMVNARHLFYGVSMVEKYNGAGRKKPYLMFALTDETYSLVCGGDCPEKMDFHSYAIAVSVMNHAYWITGTVLGALAGAFVSVNFAGVDFAMTALFITVFVEQWKSTKNHLPALIGVFASVFCLLIFGKDSFLIPSMLLISVSLSFGRKVISRKVDA
ncbi:MAG: AzlC family ABC transporter permease [Clostridia bacterium]|nr:AzlC family ABC transporter permease [Clostridia bacterium]